MWWIALLLALVLPIRFGYAACSDPVGSDPPVRTAASATRTEVAACVSAASSGDKILVPAGTQTWASAINISTKDLWIQGAGIGQTNITCTGGYCFDIGTFQGGPSSASRISGFTMNNSIADMRGLDGDKTFIIDSNEFLRSSAFDWDITGMNGTPHKHPTGLIANNIFHNTRVYVHSSFYSTTESGCGSTCAYQHEIWAQDTPWGDFANVVYVDNNTFYGGGGGASAIDIT